MAKFDVAVIGSGPGGYVAALRAAKLGLKTVCIEKEQTLGGTCLNVGCIPSKALLQSTELFAFLQKDGAEQGIKAGDLSFDYLQTQKRKGDIVKGLVTGIAGLFKSHKVEAKEGVAEFINPNTIKVTGKQNEEIEAAHFIIATGSAPTQLPFLPFDEEKIVSSTGALCLSQPPKKMIVIGAGVIGVELASVFSRLGTEIKIVEMLDRICNPLDLGISKMLLQILKKQGLEFHLETKLLKGQAKDDQVTLYVEMAGKTEELSADVVLVAVGRKPYIQGLNLEKVAIQVDNRGFIPVDGNFRTAHSHIFAIGDIIEGPMLAHRASLEGIAVAEIIAGHHPKVNYMAVPSVIYTHPEVASVGLSEQEAQQKGLRVKVGSAPFKANPRARCIGFSEGLVKVIAEEKSRRLIGFHIIGPQASELIAEASLAIDQRATIEDVAFLCHAHPTLSETVHEAVFSLL